MSWHFRYNLISFYPNDLVPLVPCTQKKTIYFVKKGYSLTKRTVCKQTALIIFSLNNLDLFNYDFCSSKVYKFV